jgi:hypothetical protein
VLWWNSVLCVTFYDKICIALPLSQNEHILTTRTLFVVAGIAQWYSAGIRAGCSGVRVPAGAGNFSLHHHIHTGSGAHLASYPMGTRGSFTGGKAAGA